MRIYPLPIKSKPFLYNKNTQHQGYVRFILTIYGLHLVTQKNSAGLHIYAFSSFLDAFDGYAARALNHGSVFGQLVDMTLDRTATVCLQLVIATLKPQLAMPMILLIMLDIISHWCHTSYAYMSQKHHKMIPARNLLMRIYYGNRVIFYFLNKLKKRSVFKNIAR